MCCNNCDVSQLDFKLQIFALGMLHVPMLVHLHLQVECLSPTLLCEGNPPNDRQVSLWQCVFSPRSSKNQHIMVCHLCRPVDLVSDGSSCVSHALECAVGDSAVHRGLGAAWILGFKDYFVQVTVYPL